MPAPFATASPGLPRAQPTVASTMFTLQTFIMYVFMPPAALMLLLLIIPLPHKLRLLNVKLVDVVFDAHVPKKPQLRFVWCVPSAGRSLARRPAWLFLVSSPRSVVRSAVGTGGEVGVLRRRVHLSEQIVHARWALS